MTVFYPHPSRRMVAAGAVMLVGSAACRDRASAGPRPARQVRTLSSLGVDRFTGRDQWSRLRDAFQAAHAGGFDIAADGDADYRHDGPLLLDGVSMDGHGCTLTALSDGPQVLHCVGDGWRVANLRVLCAARARTAENYANGVMVGDEDGRPATNFVLENVVVDAAAPGCGAGGTGFMFNSASRGRVSRVTARRSWADGIHVTNGSHDLVFERPLSENTGDDGFAVVSYRAHGRLCHSIRVTDGISRDSGARGCSVVGGRDVIYERFVAERSAAAGAYLYGEEAFDTYGVYQCRLIAPVLRNCVTGRGLPTGFAQAVITIGGRNGADTMNGAVLSRGAVDCVVTDPVVEGVGASCWAGISMHQYAVNTRITGGSLSNLVPTSGSFRPNGVEIGGHNLVVEGVCMRNVAGIAVVVTVTASGNCVVNRPEVTGSLLRPGPISSYVYVDVAPAVRRITVMDGRFTGGPAQLAIDRLPRGRVRLLNNRLL